MYEACFGLFRRPFASVPQIDHYFPGTAIEEARERAIRCIERGEGAALVVGPSGTGKSLLCRMLADQFQDAFRVALLASGRLATRRALLQAILYELGKPYRDMDEGELRLALVDYLTVGDECPQGIALIVDEAQSLPSRALEELRMLTNISRDSQPRVRLVLAGNDSLEERLASPKFDSFTQRLAVRGYLEAFNQTETTAYVQHQVRSAGGDADRLFPDETCQAVYRATNGVPRLINQLGDYALLLAQVSERQTLEPLHIEEAWADLQQLPAPSPVAAEAEGGVIEFGSLDDEPEPLESGDEARSEVPPLRISPETQEEHSVEVADVELVERLEDVEEMLATATVDFEPAASIQPEVELVFEDPFREHFEKEEVIACQHDDPMCQDDTSVLAASEETLIPEPLVVEAVGQPLEEPTEMTALIESFQPAAEPNVIEANTVESIESTGGGCPSFATGDFVTEDERLSAEVDSDSLGTSEAITVAADPISEEDDPISEEDDNEPRETVPLRPDQVALAGEVGEEERQMVVIDDDPEGDETRIEAFPVLPVRRREYGQLFAKLRRG